MNDVVAHTSFSTHFVEPFSLILGTPYKTAEAIPDPAGGIHDFSKRYRRRSVTKTTAREGNPNATSSPHFFHRPRMIVIKKGAVARSTKVADGPK